MDEKLSFMPKRKLSSQAISRRGWGGFVLLSFFIFVISMALWGGLYMYKNYLNDNITQLGKVIENQKASFEIPTVNEIIDFSEKISVARNLLAGHKDFSGVLDFLQDFTMKDVRFNGLDYSYADSGEPSLILSGTTRSYAGLTAQIKTLGKYNQVKRISLSGLSLDTTGAVNFNLGIILNPAIAAYTVK